MHILTIVFRDFTDKSYFTKTILDMHGLMKFIHENTFYPASMVVKIVIKQL